MSDWLQFFFKAMSGPDSYAGGGKAKPMQNFSDWKGFECEEGPFQLVDRYIVLPNGFSMGVTTQRVEGCPILHMQYGGYYPKEVTPLLRRALLTQYRLKDFRAFRGPAQYPAEPTDTDEYIYRNMPYEPPMWVDASNTMPYAVHINEYRQSAGQEAIVKNQKGRQVVGWHDYHYMVFKPAV
jgi:hypothetical protein